MAIMNMKFCPLIWRFLVGPKLNTVPGAKIAHETRFAMTTDTNRNIKQASHHWDSKYYVFHYLFTY